MKAKLLGAAALLATALVVLGCGGGSNGAETSSSSGAGAGKALKATWLYTGPKDDGGYNASQVDVMNGMGQLPGVTADGIYNIPYSQQASQTVKQAIAGGSNVIVDTLGLADLLTSVCEQAPDVYCYASGDPAPQPENSRSWWPKDWNLSYISGVAAGLMTKTGTIGFIGSYDIPLLRQAVNAYALGCQSVREDCKVRAVFTNAYFDPTKSNQAASTLIDAGVDVLRNWVDDPGFCQMAEKRGVYAVGEFYDFKQSCPKSIITSTVWDFGNYFKDQVAKMRAGKFEGSGSTPDLIDVGSGAGEPRLGAWGDFVPDDVRAKVEKVYAEMVEGKPVVVGPIRDQKGTERFKAGEVVPDAFMFSEWKWLVAGVTTSK